MAIKKENASLSASSEKLRNKKGEGLIRVRHDLKEKEVQKNYEAGIDPQDQQFNTHPEGRDGVRGTSKPGGGDRVYADDGKGNENSPGEKDTKK